MQACSHVQKLQVLLSNKPWYIRNSQICMDFDVPFFAAYIIAVTNSFAGPGSP